MYNETRGLVNKAVKCKTMGKYRNYKHFPNERQEKTFLYPHVCLSCRKSFKKSHSEQPRLCPDCQQPLILLSRNFSAAKTDKKIQWKKVAFVIEHGFLFLHVYQDE
jgi:predicted Zn-ribbon and HTH transcriptional regulator